MHLRDYRVGWRLLQKEPGYSLAVVLGLAVGFAACFLLLGLVRYSFTYNAAIADSAHIFVVKERRNMLPRPDWRATAPAPLRDVATRSGPQVSATSARSFDLAARIDNRVVALTLQVADANFIDFFGIRTIEGDAKAALARPDALVLSQSQARKLFGAAHALGKRLSIDGTPFEVKAIIADLPANTSVRYDVLLGAGLHSWDPVPTRAGAEWFSSAAVYIKAPPSVDGAALAALLQAAVAPRDARLTFKLPAGSPYTKLTDIGMVRLSEIYFDPDLLAGRGGARYGNKAGVAGLAEAIGRDSNKIVYNVVRPGLEPVAVEAKLVSPEFFDVYRVRALAGRVFDPGQDGPASTSVVINASAAAALGFASPQEALGQMFNATLRIVGIAPDLRYQTLRQAPGPMVYRIDVNQGVLTARVDGDGAMATVRPQVEALLARHFPNAVPDIEPAGAVFANNYSDDLRLAQILAAASVVATALASFGIYVLSAYSVRRRAREIVLRKLYGADGLDVGRLIACEFAVLIGIGALIGLPVAWFATERYLSGFAERAPLGWWPPLLALGCVGLVALAATARHTLAAVRMSPALALQN